MTLQPGQWSICGGGSFRIIPSRSPGDGAPVAVFIAGAGGLYKGQLPAFAKAPLPLWAVVIDLPGNAKVRTPPWLVPLLRHLRAITTPSRNAILMIGFSRGGAWLIDCALQAADCIDAAIACAGYPWTKCEWTNENEARTLMQVRIPLLLIHYDRDEFCNAGRNPKWFAQFELAMAAPPGNVYGQRQQCFVSVMVSGVHNDARDTWNTLDFASLSDAAPQQFWRSIWEAIERKTVAASASERER